jgi:RNA polymerase sigma-70 factor (ECF subfamily)
LTVPDPPADDLLDRARAGDEEAFAALAEAWHPRIFRWACGLLGDPDDADDVAQQVLVRFYTHLDGFRRSARLSTWLYQITQNAARDAVRRQRRRAGAVERMRTLAPPAATSPAPSFHVEQDEVVERARAAVACLPQRQRSVFDLVDLQGYAPQEAATMLGVAPATARVHLLRARRALRSALIDDRPSGENGTG